jgi:BASS family bile acid:Na+ symporter
MFMDFALPAALVLIMLGLGLSLEWRHFRDVIVQKKAITIGLASMLLTGPLVALVVLSILPIDPYLAAGILVVMTCPSGLTSNLLAHLGGGNVALSVSLTASSTILYVAAAPFLLPFIFLSQGLAASGVNSPMGLAGEILLLTIGPIVAGMLARKWWPRLARSLEGWVRGLGMLVIVATFAMLVASDWARLGEAATRALVPLTITSIATLTLVYVIGTVSGLPRADILTLCLEHAMRQEGTALYVTLGVAGSAVVALPLLLNAVVGAILGLCLILLLRPSGRQVAAEAAGAAG